MQRLRAMASSSSSQAHALLNGAAPSRGEARASGTPTLLVASGRGGSGTTLIATLLAVAAAGDGHRVLLVDADDLVGPVAMRIGVAPHATWLSLRSSDVSAADVALQVTDTLTLVAGGVMPGANTVAVSSAERRACMRRLSPLMQQSDLVVIDCGSRLDSLSAAIAPHAAESLIAVASGSDPVALAATFALCKAARARHAAMSLQVIVNRLDERDAMRCFEAVNAGANQFLASPLHLAGVVPFDRSLDAALQAGMSFWDAAAGSPAALAAHDVVLQLLSNTSLPLARTGT